MYPKPHSLRFLWARKISPIFLVSGLLSILSGHGLSNNLGLGSLQDYFHIHHAPDPVNVRTGNFYLPSPDYYLPCYGFNLELHRSYNSYAANIGSFGRGWLHNYEVTLIMDTTKGLSIREADGFVTAYTPMEERETQGDRLVDALVNAKLKEDKRATGNTFGAGPQAYKNYRERLKRDPAFLAGQKAKYASTLSNVSSSRHYFTQNRGYSEVRVLPNQQGYERTHETGQVDTFNAKGKLVKMRDRHGNTLNLSYNTQGRLANVSDGCKQALQFSYNKQGLVEMVTDHLQRKMIYAYDSFQRLQFATAIDAKTTEYVYNVQHQMIGVKFNPKEIVTIIYDPQSGKVKSQQGPGKKITNYKYSSGGGVAVTEVTDNEGENSRYEFIDGENKSVYTDRSGQSTITTFMACCGKILSQKLGKGPRDPKASGETFAYDKDGRLVSRTNAMGQISTLRYDPRSETDFTFRLPIEIVDFDKTVKTYNYDAKGNLTFAKSSTGEYVRLTYEEHGKVRSITNKDGVSVHFVYDKGVPVLIEKRSKDKLGAEAVNASLRIDYDAFGQVREVAYKPKLSRTVDDMKATLISLFKILKPVGMDFEL